MNRSDAANPVEVGRIISCHFDAGSGRYLFGRFPDHALLHGVIDRQFQLGHWKEGFSGLITVLNRPARSKSSTTTDEIAAPKPDPKLSFDELP
jgi:hypothetical protein